MRRQACIGLGVFAVLVILGVNLSLAQGLQDQAGRRAIRASITSIAARAPWFIDEVDSPEVGEHVSVAVHPETGTTYVSYYDADSQDLHLATYVGSGGDCGPDNSWECERVDIGGNVGQYNSIDIYTGTHPILDRWKLGIAYYDATNYALKFAEYAYVTFPTPGYVWTVSQIISGTGGTFWTHPGMYASLKYTSDGVPHIAYYRDTNWIDQDSVLHAYEVLSGGNCGPVENWQCDPVDTGEGLGQYASLDLTSYGSPWIAYYDEDAGYPRIAKHTGGGWSLDIPVSQPPLDTGRHVSLVLDDSNVPHIAYYNVTSGTLEYAKWVGSNGNCADNGFGGYLWQCDEIDYVGTYMGSSRRVSIALDGAGYPIIAYQDASAGTQGATLKVARPIGALGGPPFLYSGNCGPQISPPPFPVRSWQCDTVDSGSSHINEAGSVSLAINSAGLATIAYHEYRFTLPESTENLKVAYQRQLVFLPLVPKSSP